MPPPPSSYTRDGGLDLEWEEEEQDLLLELQSSSPTSSTSTSSASASPSFLAAAAATQRPRTPRPPPQQQQQIRWDRIVTAGLGVMALTSLLFVATDSSSLLYFTPLPTDGASASRVRASEAGSGGAGTRPSSFYTTLSYKDEAAAASSSQGSNRRRRQQPPCNYTLLSADPQGVQWGQEDSEKGVLAPVGHAACRVRLFEGAEGHREALRCLKGKHLLFLGDSLSRYQYLSLVHFLDAGTWEEGNEEEEEEKGSGGGMEGGGTGGGGVEKKGGQVGGADTAAGAAAKEEEEADQQQQGLGPGRSITYREGWGGDWNDFYRLSSASLASSRGREVCDCARDGHTPWAENRYFSLRLPFSSVSTEEETKDKDRAASVVEEGEMGGGGSDDRVLRVSFIGWFGGVGPRGHALPGADEGGIDSLTQETLGCSPGACRGPLDWKASPAEFLRGALLREQLKPDVVLLNTGLWKALDAGPQLDALVDAAKALKAASSSSSSSSNRSVDVYWKTTTSRAVGAVWVNDTIPRNAFLQAGLKVFDASLFTLALRNHSELYRDGTTHYAPEVYRGLNRLLLNELCPPLES